MKHGYLLLAVLLLILAAPCAKAQTKVFKAVAEDMDQDFQAIFQDGRLVGYLVFTQLERASADSFNYRISIMDENLNDIGSVNFREEKLNLKGVSFDQDILCLAYVKTNFVGKEYKNQKELNRDINNCRAALFTQFLALNGKIIATGNVKMDVAPEFVLAANSNRHGFANGRLKHSIQLRNISGKGFVCFYGDDKKNNLVVFNTTGKLTWQKQIHEDFVDIGLLTSDTDINLLIKTKDAMVEGGYAILSYNAVDSATYPKFILKDRRGNALKVLTFENDPVSGKPYVAGLVIDSVRGNHFGYGRAIRHGPYSGVFTINLNGHTRKEIQASFSYWNNGSQSFIDKYGYLPESHEYANIERAFKDYQGNTIFAACGVIDRVRWGAITGAVLTAWSIYGAPLFLAGGTNKFATRDVMLFKQDASGQLTLATTVPTPRSAFGLATASVTSYDRCGYYTVRNSDTRTEYLVIDKPKDIDIYNINQKKIARTIPHQEGNNILTVYPAKEGYVMVYDFNKKEKTTRLSIEAL
jgi:hypothetical protein